MKVIQIVNCIGFKASMSRVNVKVALDQWLNIQRKETIIAVPWASVQQLHNQLVPGYVT